MRLTRAIPAALGILAATAVTVLAGAAPASAQSTTPRTPEIGNLVPVAVRDHGGETVKVVGQYRCWGPSDTMHVWVSVKQGGPDPTAEGSSSTVDAWYDTNVSQDVAVTCDGRWHVKVVTLGRNATDFTGRPLAKLRSGKAWLQFCMVPATEDFIFASKSRWVHVVGAHA
jgi:hypothetical protein